MTINKQNTVHPEKYGSIPYLHSKRPTNRNGITYVLDEGSPYEQFRSSVYKRCLVGDGSSTIDLSPNVYSGSTLTLKGWTKEGGVWAYRDIVDGLSGTTFTLQSGVYYKSLERFVNGRYMDTALLEEGGGANLYFVRQGVEPIVEDDIEFHLDMRNPYCYNGVSSVVTDLVNGEQMTFIGTGELLDEFGGVYHFDVGFNGLQLSSSKTFTTGKTISVLAKSYVTTRSTEYLLLFGGTSTTYFRFEYNNRILAKYNGTTLFFHTPVTPSAPLDLSYAYITLVYELNGILTVYINGVKTTASKAANGDLVYDRLLGSLFGSGAVTDLALFTIYDRPLKAEEVRHNYNVLIKNFTN